MTCNKTRYPSRARAQSALKGIRKRGDRNAKKPTRAYVCEFCHGWHLTSQYQ